MSLLEIEGLSHSFGDLDQYAEIEKDMTMQSFLKSTFSGLYQLEIHDFYSIDTQIEQVANGLGLLAIGLNRPINKTGGGQRAKLLLEKPDVLLLDELTNFLDKEHITWLSDSGLDRKQLDRMEKMEALDQKEITPHSHFPEVPLTNTEHLLVKCLSAGYYYPVLSKVDFAIKGGQKVVITGFNGVGKLRPCN